MVYSPSFTKSKVYHSLFACFLDSGVIRQYRVRVFGEPGTGYEETFTTSSTVQLVDGLQCCSNYRFSVSAFTITYGPAAGDMAFRTNPDLSSI